MGENLNKEIRLTIRQHEPIPPQSSSTADCNGWRAEMLTKIKKTADNPNTNTPNQESSMEIPKISIPPDAFLKNKQKPYCPEVLTIGPLYADLGTKSDFDDRKALCVNNFMQRHGKSDVEDIIKHLIPEPYYLEKDYSSLPGKKYTDDSLKLLLTVDTIFVHEFLLFFSPPCPNSIDKELDHLLHFFHSKLMGHHEPTMPHYLSTSFNNGVEWNQVWRDLFLIGNQIPMSFLHKIAEYPGISGSKDFEIDRQPNIDTHVKLKNLQRVLVDTVVRNCPFPKGHHDWPKHFRNPNLFNCNHLLDCQYVLVTHEIHEHRRSPQFQDHLSTNQGAGTLTSNHRDRLPTASQLSKVGIRFKACEGNVTVIKYHPMTLHLDLPRIVVHKGTEDVLRNLLAYEQTSKDGGEFTKYAIIMDSLIDTPEDVAILTKAGVIVNHLGDDVELVNLWNELYDTNIVIKSCERWDKMTSDVLEHYRSPWRPLYVEFREKFFSRPWLTASVTTAILLVVLTLLQTIYTILPYYY